MLPRGRILANDFVWCDYPSYASLHDMMWVEFSHNDVRVDFDRGNIIYRKKNKYKILSDYAKAPTISSLKDHNIPQYIH